MGYIVQKTRASQLLVNGADYTSSLVSFQVSDSSAYKNGLITTTGSLVLGQRQGGANIEDYDRNIFKRGVLVTLDVVEPGGTIYRHPRGYLYVMSVAYDVESEQLVVELGCKIALAYLTDKADAVLALVPIYLDPAQRTIQNAAASFASAGEYLYQNNQGELVSGKFFEGDSSAGVAAGEWVSVLGETVVSVSPLAGGTAIPDTIELSYQIPSGLIASDGTGKVDTVTEDSNYFISYPATTYTRNPPVGGGVPGGGGGGGLPPSLTIPPISNGIPSGCGNTPARPTFVPTSTTSGGSGIDGATYVFTGSNTGPAPIACAQGWTTNRTTIYLPATRSSVSTTTYGAPGAQVSFTRQEVSGPAVEANAQYFADKYAYCTSTYGYGCNPTGNCPYYGMNQILLSYTETNYEYDPASNALRQTVQDTYRTTLSAAITSDWRSGVNNGIPQSFNGDLSETTMYRASRVITTYSQVDNANVQEITTFTSSTSRGVGISSPGSIDALQGIVTTVRRESTTNTTLDVRPDSVNSPTTATTELITDIILRTNSFQTPPTEAGEYVLEEQIPVPLLTETREEADEIVATYSNYISRFVKGDLYGLQIAEAMRAEIVSNWRPGMPFRYADTANNTISAMRMDACAWGVDQEESLVVINGIWIGFSSGSLSMGSNLVGNSRPDMTPPSPGGGGGTPGPAPTPQPVPDIDNDQVGQSFAFVVDVDMYLQSYAFTYSVDGVRPPENTDFDIDTEISIVPYVDGFIVASGGLLSTTGTGNIPVEANGSLVTSGATVVNGNLFS